MSAVAENANRCEITDWQRIDLYRFFAKIFATPSQECFEFMGQPSARESLRELWFFLGAEAPFPEFDWFSSYDLYESGYIGLFDVGLPEPAVPLFESAHDKSHPAQEIALENTYFYDVLGLKTDSAQAVPDYLITQLEFLSALTYAQENSLGQENSRSLELAKVDFLDRHLLNWVPLLDAKLKRTGSPGFPALASLLLQFLRKERAEHRTH